MENVRNLTRLEIESSLSPVTSQHRSIGSSGTSSFAGLSADSMLRNIAEEALESSDSPHRLERLWIPSAWRVSSERSGPNLTVFGGVHGNEPCGVYAVCELLRRFSTGALHLERGTVTLCIANEQALFHGVRSTDFNMNRLFVDERHIDTSYTVRRTEALKQLLIDSDIHLDLHSTSEPSAPFILVEDAFVADVKDIPIPYIVTTSCEDMERDFSGTTQSFARRHGANALTIENGQHQDPRSKVHALAIVESFLCREDMIAKEHEHPPLKPMQLNQQSIKLKTNETFRFHKPFRSFEKLHAGQVIGSELGEIIRAPEDCYIVLPTAPAKEPRGAYLYLLATENHTY